MGVPVSPAEILVSGQATARFLTRAYPCGTRVHVFGMPALKQALTDEGFILADDGNEYFFHNSACSGVTFDELRQDQAVVFERGQGPKGPRGENVRLA